jgi:MoaA/NifB/PqqE/SkfB family radical SAM enzyme
MKWEKREISFSMFKKIIAQMPNLKHINFCGIGEPLLHEDFLDMLSLIKEHNRRKTSVSFSTNGMLLDKDVLKELVHLRVEKISISIDGLGKTLENIRGIKFNELASKIALLNELKRTYKTKYPMLEIEFVGMKQNVHELPKVIQKMNRLGASDIYFLHPFCLSPAIFEQHLHNLNERKTYSIFKKSIHLSKKNGIRLRLRPLQPKPTLCYEPWYQVTVTEDGKVKPCGFIGILYSPFKEYYFDSAFEIDPENFILNNDINEHILKVWKSEQYQNLRKLLLSLRKNEKGHNCSREQYLALRKGAPLNTVYCQICQYRFQTAC